MRDDTKETIVHLLTLAVGRPSPALGSVAGALRGCGLPIEDQSEGQEVEGRAPPRKAIIFTESRRMQEYLHGMLTTNGYSDAR
jgi:hypothetical protein